MQKTIKQKEKIKPDKDRVGNTFNCCYSYAISVGNNEYLDPTTGKKYREVKIDTSLYL